MLAFITIGGLILFFVIFYKWAKEHSEKEYAINKPMILDILSGLPLMSGLEIHEALEKRQGRVIGYGSIYLALSRLVDLKVVERVHCSSDNKYRYRILVISPSMFKRLPKESRDKILQEQSQNIDIINYYKDLDNQQ
jgi:predicted transcriptional regulator